MLKEPSEYGIPADSIKRVYVAVKDKSWSAIDLSFDELIKQIYDKDPWVSMRLELMDAFGLRIQEATLLQPAAADGGSILRVEMGTKGGRSRLVQIQTAKQRDVLNRAKSIAHLSETRNLIPSGKTLAQALARAYYICGLFGITKNGMEITPHGLRAGFANDRYEQLSGMPSTVRGTPEKFDPEKDRLAREIVSRELGHSRLSITGAYTGARVRGRPKAVPKDEGDDTAEIC